MTCLRFFVGRMVASPKSSRSEELDSGAGLVVAVVSSWETTSGGEEGSFFLTLADGRWKKLSRLSWTFRVLALLSSDDKGFRGEGGTTISVTSQHAIYFLPRTLHRLQDWS